MSKLKRVRVPNALLIDPHPLHPQSNSTWLLVTRHDLFVMARTNIDLGVSCLHQQVIVFVVFYTTPYRSIVLLTSTNNLTDPRFHVYTLMFILFTYSFKPNSLVGTAMIVVVNSNSYYYFQVLT